VKRQGDRAVLSGVKSSKLNKEKCDVTPGVEQARAPGQEKRRWRRHLITTSMT